MPEKQWQKLKPGPSVAGKMVLPFAKQYNGPDKRVPSRGHLEGHACRAHRIKMDDRTWCGGSDKQVPPTVGAACLSGPMKLKNREKQLLQSRLSRTSAGAGP